ncbi:uncharacterized protein LOC108865162 [Galendromus occidentalis]|uniref:Uncharacterized protein LOC108865162 n=1 Tax=Galendromus occidentalis TaxID=34638 RepID=A0AAJ7L8Q9_9ACAR|nr:uncharacterized protein LOC108865162 [Galendromus occidentalis]
MHLPFAVLSSVALLTAGQQVRSFYSGPVASYSNEYNLGPAQQYAPVQSQRYAPDQAQQYAPIQQPQSPEPYAYRAVPQRRFEPVQQVRALPAAVPVVSAQPAFRADRNYPTVSARYPTNSISSVRTTLQPVAGNVAVPAYPVAAGVRLGGVRGAALEDRINYPPTPYAFEYSVQDGEGGHSRQERGDGNGRVTGSYTIQLADGRSRIVEYIADEGGYRANIRTNEFGTESQSPADVGLQSSAIPAREATLIGERDSRFRQFGPSTHKKA